jgi:hypothetical protein
MLTMRLRALPEMTPEQREGFEATRKSLEHLAMRIVALPNENREHAFAAARKSLESRSATNITGRLVLGREKVSGLRLKFNLLGRPLGHITLESAAGQPAKIWIRPTFRILD